LHLTKLTVLAIPVQIRICITNIWF